MTRNGPTYDLNTIRSLVRAGNYHITLSAKQSAVALGLATEDIETCILSIAMSDFYKSMPAEKIPGLFQDVYRPIYAGMELYIKLQITYEAVVFSFKER